MKQLIKIFVFLILNSITAQDNFTINKGETKEKKYVAIFNYEDIRGKIIIDVTINNQIKKFILDTGAPTSMSEKLLADINYTSLKKIMVSDANNKEGELEIVEIPEFSIANLTFIKSYVLKISDMSLFNCFGVDGVIGSNSLRNSVVDFDYKNKKITITDHVDNLKFSNIKSEKLFVDDMQSSPLLKIQFIKGDLNISETVLFDSGDDTFYSLSKNTFYQILNDYKKNNPETQLNQKSQLESLGVIANSEGSFDISLYGNANANRQYKFKIPEMKFHQANFENIISTSTDGEGSRIGSEILKHGRLTLDYKKRKYYFQPYQTTKNIDVNHQVRSFYPTIENNKFVVGIVWDEHLKELMKVGDEILKINDLDFSLLTKCQILMLSKEAYVNSEKQIVTLKDVDNHQIKIIDVFDKK